MQFTKKLRGRIKSGEITTSIRIWTRPHVKVGSRYPMEDGHIVIESMREISLQDITQQIATESGFAGVIDLLKTAKHGNGRRVYLIEFRFETR